MLPKQAQIIVQRTWKSNESTVGTLTFGDLQLYTLEDVVRAPGVKVYGETAIPAGMYELQITMSNRFKKLLPLVLNVPGFEGIRIHAGNTAKDTEGCLLLGLQRQPNFVGQSVAAMAMFMPKLEAALKLGKVYIEYRN